MSRERERELLKKILATGWLNNTISCEVEELLAQPEQEQEPVAWGYKKRVTYKPEGSEEEEIIPLYTAQPKREPLSDEQKKLEAIAIKQREAHGFGGGE